jgi:hypothetical protein
MAVCYDRHSRAVDPGVSANGRDYFAQSAAKCLIPERFTRYLPRYAIDRYTDGTD